MVKVIGTGKVGPGGKMPLSESAAKAMGIRKGDSVLFSRTPEGSEVVMNRAEGYRPESGAPVPDGTEVFGKLRFCTLAAVAASALLLILIIAGHGSENAAYMAVSAVLLILAIASAGLANIFGGKMGRIRPSSSPLSVSGPSVPETWVADARGHSGKRFVLVYADDMMGARPSRLTATIGGPDCPAECIQVRASAGYSAYMAMLPDADVTGKTMHIDAHYQYDGKTIDVGADFVLSENNGSFKAEEKGFGAEMTVDYSADRADFDDSLFDPASGGSKA